MTKNILWMAVVALAVLPAQLFAEGASEKNATVVETQSAKYGAILTDNKGLTLYVFQKDTPGTTACYGACAQYWPPLLVGEGQKLAAGYGVTGKLGTTQRTDGSSQVTYNGMPLYLFAKDTAAGESAGQDVGPAGAKWYVVPVGAATFARAMELSENPPQAGSSTGHMGSAGY